ncbi:MAG: EamA family transporter [Candidatus Peribacteria bacterium]|nr:MAG: EamA family transporter [Candidatus Peribacteria bacterium]
MNLQKYHSRFIDPILFFWRDPGARLYLVTIVCYSFTNIFDKIGVTETSPVFWIFMMNVFLLVMSLKDMKQSYVQDMQVVKKKYLSFGSTFAFYAGSHITQMFAIQYLFVSYLSAIKIASMLLVIIFGGLFFKEQGVLKKAMVGTIIVFGVILIYFA